MGFERLKLFFKLSCEKNRLKHNVVMLADNWGWGGGGGTCNIYIYIYILKDAVLPTFTRIPSLWSVQNGNECSFPYRHFYL